MGLFDTKPKKAPPPGSPQIITPPSPQHAPQLKSPSTILGPGLQVMGEMTADEDVIIEGRFSGKLSSTARISIGRNGVVEADLFAETIQITGRVKGNLAARQKIELVAGGYLEGNIQTPKVVVAEGAIFKGNVDMTAPAQPALDSSLSQRREAVPPVVAKKEPSQPAAAAVVFRSTK